MDKDENTLIELRRIFGVSVERERNFFDEKRRPANWSKSANAPYYNEKCALELKSEVDGLIESAKNGIFDELIYSYLDHRQYSPNTLYLKVNQSKLFLLDHLDPEGIYKTFFEYVRITRDKGRGVRISFVDKNPEKELNPTSVVPKEIQHDHVEDQVSAFLENAKPNDKLHIKNISLGESDINILKISLQELNDIVYRVKANEVFIVKLSEADASKIS